MRSDGIVAHPLSQLQLFGLSFVLFFLPLFLGFISSFIFVILSERLIRVKFVGSLICVFFEAQLRLQVEDFRVEAGISTLEFGLEVFEAPQSFCFVLNVEGEAGLVFGLKP